MSTTGPVYSYSCMSMSASVKFCPLRNPLKLERTRAPLQAFHVTVRLYKYVSGAATLGEGCEGDMGTIYEQNTTHKHTTELPAARTSEHGGGLYS